MSWYGVRSAGASPVTMLVSSAAPNVTVDAHLRESWDVPGVEGAQEADHAERQRQPDRRAEHTEQQRLGHGSLHDATA